MTAILILALAVIAIPPGAFSAGIIRDLAHEREADKLRHTRRGTVRA